MRSRSRVSACLAVAGLLVACLTGDAAADATPTPPANVRACVPADQCCAVCDAGKACGNSCISRKKQCHKGRGCSCNAAEICAEP